MLLEFSNVVLLILEAIFVSSVYLLLDVATLAIISPSLPLFSRSRVHSVGDVDEFVVQAGVRLELLFQLFNWHEGHITKVSLPPEPLFPRLPRVHHQVFGQPFLIFTAHFLEEDVTFLNTLPILLKVEEE